MKKLAFLTLAVVAAACSGGDESQETFSAAVPSGEGITPAQIEAFKKLEGVTHQPWVWIQHDLHQTPMHLSAARMGKPVLARGADPAYTTLSVLEENKALFKMKSPAAELAIAKTVIDEIGMTHARFQQTVRGVPVVGAELMAHYDEVGRLTSIDANYVADLEDMDLEPKLLASDALSMVKADIVSKTVVEEATLEADEGKLVVYAPAAKQAKLAYQHTVRALAAKEPAIWVTTVDAKTGEILDRYNNLQTIQGQGLGVMGDSKTFEVASGGNGYVMTDASGGVQILTYTAKQVQTTPGTQVTSTTATTWDTGVPGAGAAVDAHVNASVVFKYYKDKHARSSIDGNGGAMISTAHFGKAYDNAAWDGTGMLYGDGGQLFRALSASLDVVGHEFTHGVTEKTSNLTYQNQSGALNEAVSDIFGAFIEHSVKPDEVKNWSLGETISKSGTALRDMKNPSAVEDPQPAHMTKFVNTQQDNGGVHINSGIINNAAYLMTVGGVNPVSKVEVKYGIGWDKSEKLWYRANTKYFLSSTNFAQAAQGVLQAAKDIGLTANETNIVECAFKATGIAQGACATLIDPKGTAPNIPGTQSGTGGTVGDDGTSVPGDTSADEPDTTSTKKTRRRRVVSDQGDGGCNASGGTTSSAPALMVMVVLGLAASRRKKRD